MANILIVDDSKSMRKLVSHCLETAGHSVVAAEDGVLGLKAAEQMEYDLVVSDINMPNMDGIEMITQLRLLPTYKFTPILVLTTESGQDMKTKGKQAGATGWIVKPFNPSKLVAAISKVCK